MNDKPTRKRGKANTESESAVVAQKPQKQLSETGALMRFLAMGDTRTLPKLHELLAGEGYPVRLQMLRGWSSTNGWTALAQEFDEKRKAALTDMLFESARDMDLRQANLGRSMQAIVERDLGKLKTRLDLTLKPQDLVRWAEVGVKIERLATGAATSRNEGATYNTVIMPVLALFQQIVAGLPEGTRDIITRQFADGVNQIRDAMIVEDSVGDGGHLACPPSRAAR